jgi:hypothetical protein
MTALCPVKLTVTPEPMTSDWKARTSMLGPLDCVIVWADGKVCPHVAPVQPVPSYFRLPVQARFTGPTGDSAASWAAVRFVGVYPKPDAVHAAGIPGLCKAH